jgi:quinol monooxygenase YgiN
MTMSVIGWHTARIPGGVTPEAVKVLEEMAQWLQEKGATNVHVVKLDDHHYRMIDFWPDIATHDQFVKAASTPAVQAQIQRFRATLHFEDVGSSGLEGHFQWGRGEIVATH